MRSLQDATETSSHQNRMERRRMERGSMFGGNSVSLMAEIPASTLGTSSCCGKFRVPLAMLSHLSGWKSIPPLGLPTAHKSVTTFFGLSTGWPPSCLCRSLPGAEMKGTLFLVTPPALPRMLGIGSGAAECHGDKRL